MPARKIPRNFDRARAMHAPMKQKPTPFILTANATDYEITPVPEGIDPMAFMEQMMHDCPDCRAARARGEVPQIVSFGPGHATGGLPTESRQVRRAVQRKYARWQRRSR